MRLRFVSASVAAAAIAVASIAWAVPPAKGWKSSITDPTVATAATVHITKSSSAQIKVGSGVVTFVVKLNGVQDVFNMPVTTVGNTVEFVFLVNGVMLQGEIGAFDLFCMLLERDGLCQLVYKHAISTVQPENPVNFQEAQAEE